LISYRNKPFQLWHTQVNSDYEESRITRVTDEDIQSLVIEIVSPNVSTTHITCPAQLNRTLGIKLPILVLIVKNLKKYFTFEVQVMDDKNCNRRFRASNFQVSNLRAARYRQQHDRFTLTNHSLRSR
jgi:hypothetical protein